MKKKGFATSAILYTMLLLFLILMVNILNNLQNKKVILDSLKKDTINALQSDTIIDALLDQIALIDSKVVEIENKKAGILPFTGGMGTMIYTLVGCMIVIVSITGYVMYQKKAKSKI